MSTAETGASATAAAGPELGGGAATIGAEVAVEEGADVGVGSVAAASSSTGSTS